MSKVLTVDLSEYTNDLALAEGRGRKAALRDIVEALKAIKAGDKAEARAILYDNFEDMKLETILELLDLEKRKPVLKP